MWLRAEQQTAGRGRQGRTWISPPGNLYASTLSVLRAGDPPPSGLALVAGVALAEAIHQLPLRFQPMPRFVDGPIDDSKPWPGRASRNGVALKWPNDVLVARAKVAGILLERAADTVVLGFGVNVAHHPEGLDRPVTSLAAHGCPVAPEVLLRMLDVILRHHLTVWRNEGLSPVIRRWLDFADPPGAPMVARLPDGTSAEGFFEGLDPTGALLLGLASGERRVIHAADVFTL